MGNWSKSSLFKGELTFGTDNRELIHDYFTIGSAFSLWKDETNFTACQIEKIYKTNGRIYAGDTVIIEFSAINSDVTLDLEAGDLVFMGVPYRRVGSIKVEEILSKDFKKL